MKEFELFSLSSSLSKMIELSTFQSFFTAEQALTSGSEVLQKSLDRVLLDALIAHDSDVSLLSLFFQAVDSQKYAFEHLTTFESVYGYSFHDWYQAVGKPYLAKNFGVSSYTANVRVKQS
jgi:hypothetical protein